MMKFARGLLVVAVVCSIIGSVVVLANDYDDPAFNSFIASLIANFRALAAEKRNGIQFGVLVLLTPKQVQQWDATCQPPITFPRPDPTNTLIPADPLQYCNYIAARPDFRCRPVEHCESQMMAHLDELYNAFTAGGNTVAAIVLYTHFVPCGRCTRAIRDNLQCPQYNNMNRTVVFERSEGAKFLNLSATQRVFNESNIGLHRFCGGASSSKRDAMDKRAVILSFQSVLIDCLGDSTAASFTSAREAVSDCGEYPKGKGVRDCGEPKSVGSSTVITTLDLACGYWQILDHLRQVFTRLKGAGLTIKINKCQFGRPKVPYLGHLVGEGDLEPDPGKVQAVKEYPQPEMKKDVRAFLGLAGYYRRFVPNSAALAVPMTELTQKGQPHRVRWTQRQGVAFQKLKDSLVQGPVLRVADPSKPYTLQTDASDQGLGAALSQGEEHPVAFASRKLLPRVTRYSTIEEYLAIVWALWFFHIYLYGQSFTIQTDHQPLAWLQRMRNTNPRLTCWAIAVQPYCFSIVDQSGAANHNVDGLSRGAPPIDPGDERWAARADPQWSS